MWNVYTYLNVSSDTLCSNSRHQMVCCLFLDNPLNIEISEQDVVNDVQGMYRGLVLNSDADICLKGLRKLQIN